MERQELRLMLRDLESDSIERKASLSDPDGIRQAICAGLSVTDDLLLRLSQMQDDGKIQPIPSITVEKLVIEDCEMAVVIVKPSLAPPIRLSGVTWIRVGPRRAIATPEEEKILAERRRSKDLPFDLHQVPSIRMQSSRPKTISSRLLWRLPGAVGLLSRKTIFNCTKIIKMVQEGSSEYGPASQRSRKSMHIAG